MVPKGKVTRVLLGEMHLMEEPFSTVAVDLTGPLSPVSDTGNRYMLTIVHYATRYPEAIPLSMIETERTTGPILQGWIPKGNLQRQEISVCIRLDV